MFGINTVHEYVLKLIDADQCPEMNEHCPEVDKLDITKCFSGMLKQISFNKQFLFCKFLDEIPDETLFLTKPHMYGHNSTSTNVAFSPDADKHESTIYFEPTTGTPLKAQLRIQLNTNAWIDRIKIDENNATEYEFTKNKTEIKKNIFNNFRPARTRAIRRFIPMVWIDQVIIR